ncbi:hypothetical protein X797_002276 [Metarhizium robertsii]|uniref:Key lime pathogenicity protein n=2 Tax=Metarhizium robertsii TaxID=568076 RepID=E9EZI2_METRA|nr:key lime pathogenicity protein [Metarhizium robertsii ARSEF 23]EFY99373.1 key lime pathogenicity protein [Metarhizium robertsii ARSEF 23]EXV04595.1 hypothetical protein X797_002276 [Metarhizium robertsii]
MTKTTSTAREKELQYEVNTLKARVELYESHIASQNQHSPGPGPSANLSPCWNTQPSRGSRASFDVAMDGRRGHIWLTQNRQRAYSQQDHPDHLMTRSISNHSELDMPYTYGGAATSFTNAPGFVNGSSRAASINGHLASVHENDTLPDVGVHPCNYLSTHDWYTEQSYLASNGTYLSPDEAQSSFVPSAPPSMVSGFSALEPTQPLTRQNSSYGGSNGANMVRLPSSQSHHTDELSPHDPLQTTDVEDHCAMSAVSDTDFLAMGSRFSMTGQEYPPSTGNATLLLPTSVSQSMERSVSNTSVSSAQSTGSNADRRLKEALTRTLKNGRTNVIRPKADSTLPAKTSTTAPQKKAGKIPLQKTPYQRPKGPKVFCNFCNEHPDGFRGDHELRRHLNAKHKVFVKKYVCRDPETVGKVSDVKVLQPLSECKACSAGKQYGAYYNAAAHLRRTHFKPKAPRGKNKKPNDEKRGGKGGGDWPAMSELKLWFEEVEVPLDEDADECPVIAVADDEDPFMKDDNNIDGALDQAVDDDASEYDAEGDSFMPSWSPLAGLATQYQNDDVCTLRNTSVENTQMVELSSFDQVHPINYVDEFPLAGNDTGPYDAALLESTSSAPAPAFYTQESYQWPNAM